VLQTSPESHRYELYLSSGVDNDDDLDFAGLINHRLAVQEAEMAAAGVDSALEQLKSSMAAMAEMKEANKYVFPHTVPAMVRLCCSFPLPIAPKHRSGIGSIPMHAAGCRP
jgi:RNA polymerase II elongation factor ELL